MKKKVYLCVEGLFSLEATCRQPVLPAAMLTSNIVTDRKGVEPGHEHLPGLNKQSVVTFLTLFCQISQAVLSQLGSG